jgi:hypothetical protein
LVSGESLKKPETRFFEEYLRQHRDLTKNQKPGFLKNTFASTEI